MLPKLRKIIKNYLSNAMINLFTRFNVLDGRYALKTL